MSALPAWIERRLDRNLDNTLSQEHVVEVILAAERPFFSIQQVRARVDPDVGKATVRNRLNELQELDVVATESYPDSLTLYYVDHPESAWPLSPEGKQALRNTSPLDGLSTRDFLTMGDPAGIQTLVVAGLQWVLVLLALGAALTVAGVEFDARSDVVLWDAALGLFATVLAVVAVERATRWVRARTDAVDPTPSG